MDNSVTITGNLVRDPELRFTNEGIAVAHLSVAVNRRRRVGEEWKTETSFLEVRAWRDLAENICSSCQRGNRVTVAGRVEQRSWEAEDGSKRSVVEIIAEDVALSLRFATATATKTERKPEPSGYPDKTTGEPRDFDDSPF